MVGPVRLGGMDDTGPEPPIGWLIWKVPRWQTGCVPCSVDVLGSLGRMRDRGWRRKTLFQSKRSVVNYGYC